MGGEEGGDSAFLGANGEAAHLVVGVIDGGAGGEGGDEEAGEGGGGGGGEVEEVELRTLEDEVGALEEGLGEVVDGLGEVGADGGVEGVRGEDGGRVEAGGGHGGDDGEVVMDHDGNGEAEVGVGEGLGDDVGVEGVEERVGHAVALVEGSGLVAVEEVGAGLDEGGAGDGVEEVEVAEGGAVVVGGGGERDEGLEVAADMEAGDGVVGVLDVGGAVAIGGVEVEEGLEIEAGGGAAAGRAAKLAGGLKAGAVLLVEGFGDLVGDEAAEDVVAAEGADGFDFVDREWETGRLGGFEEFALAGDELGAEAAAVGWGDTAVGDEEEPKAEDAEGVGAGGEEDDGESGGTRSAAGTAMDALEGRFGDGGGVVGAEPAMFGGVFWE